MINKLQFSVEINAPKEKIWEALWSDDHYHEWASVFFEGSFMKVENWEEGSTVYFLSPDNSGIYSTIQTHVPNTIIEFKHIGNVQEGKEQPVDDETKKWSGATEAYFIEEGENGKNQLSVDIDVMDAHVEFMAKTFPLALEVIKGNCS